MAAAVRLAEAGERVVVIEAARVPGGRARRVERDGETLDNGLHILLGAYGETLSLIRLVTGTEAGLHRLALRLEIDDRFRLACARLPGALSLLAGILTASGLTTLDKLSIVRFMLASRLTGFRARSSMTVAAVLRESRQPDRARQFLWDPLCLAALNTDPALANAQTYLHVLRDGLLGGLGSHDLLLPATDLTRLFPEPAAAYVESRGGAVRLGETVESFHRHAGGFHVRTRSGSLPATHLVCATDPARALVLVSQHAELAESARAIERLSYEPIASIYLKYAAPPRLRFPMLGSTRGPVQWFFDRGALCGQRGWIGGVISASRPWLGHPAEALAAHAHEQLQDLCGELSPPLRFQVITEKRATFACVPHLLRPLPVTPMSGFYLAGDYTHGDYPATLEAATRSGTICARAILEADP